MDFLFRRFALASLMALLGVPLTGCLEGAAGQYGRGKLNGGKIKPGGTLDSGGRRGIGNDGDGDGDGDVSEIENAGSIISLTPAEMISNAPTLYAQLLKLPDGKLSPAGEDTIVRFDAKVKRSAVSDSTIFRVRLWGPLDSPQFYDQASKLNMNCSKDDSLSLIGSTNARPTDHYREDNFSADAFQLPDNKRYLKVKKGKYYVALFCYGYKDGIQIERWPLSTVQVFQPRDTTQSPGEAAESFDAIQADKLQFFLLKGSEIGESGLNTHPGWGIHTCHRGNSGFFRKWRLKIKGKAGYLKAGKGFDYTKSDYTSAVKVRFFVDFGGTNTHFFDSEETNAAGGGVIKPDIEAPRSNGADEMFLDKAAVKAILDALRARGEITLDIPTKVSAGVLRGPVPNSPFRTWRGDQIGIFNDKDYDNGEQSTRFGVEIAVTSRLDGGVDGGDAESIGYDRSLSLDEFINLIEGISTGGGSGPVRKVVTRRDFLRFHESFTTNRGRDKNDDVFRDWCFGAPKN